MDIVKAEKEEKAFQTDFCAKASFATCCLIPPEAVEIALDCVFTMDIVKNPGAYDMKKDDVEAFEYHRKHGGAPKPKDVEMQDLESSPSKKKNSKKDKGKKEKGKKTTKGGEKKSGGGKKKKTKK